MVFQNGAKFQTISHEIEKPPFFNKFLKRSCCVDLLFIKDVSTTCDIFVFIFRGLYIAWDIFLGWEMIFLHLK